jgi:pimeloyl-ACP methyl ester carboxylesterase
MPQRARSLSLLVTAVVAGYGAVDASARRASVTASGIDRAQQQALPSKTRTGARREVVSKAVTFAVQNVNRSKLACRTDGATYQIKGHIVGPRSLLGRSSRRRKRAATLYLHGLGWGEFFWSFKQVPGYDYASALARAGHISVVIDRLGYDSSGGLDGNQSCLGGQADIAHQVVGQLRSGRYAADGGAVRFRKVALAGHSAGGFIANLEAYSFKDVDALVIMSSSFASTPLARTEFLQAVNACLAGGQSAEPGGPPGYAYFGQTADAFKTIFVHSATQSVIDAAFALRNLDPCGDSRSIVPAIVQGGGSVKAIKVPVLVICGTRDALFSSKDCRLQKSRYIGARDVSLRLVKNAAHAVTLEREAAAFRKKVSRWLARRGF